MKIEVLAQMRLVAKQAEDDAIANRRDIDAAIASLLKDRDEGTVTVELEGIKVSVTYKLGRKVDVPHLQEWWGGLSNETQSAFTWKAEVSTTNLRKLEGAELDMARKFITTSPAAPSVKVEISKEKYA